MSSSSGLKRRLDDRTLVGDTLATAIEVSDDDDSGGSLATAIEVDSNSPTRNRKMPKLPSPPRLPTVSLCLLDLKDTEPQHYTTDAFGHRALLVDAMADRNGSGAAGGARLPAQLGTWALRSPDVQRLLGDAVPVVNLDGGAGFPQVVDMVQGLQAGDCCIVSASTARALLSLLGGATPEWTRAASKSKVEHITTRLTRDPLDAGWMPKISDNEVLSATTPGGAVLLLSPHHLAYRSKTIEHVLRAFAEGTAPRAPSAAAWQRWTADSAIVQRVAAEEEQRGGRFCCPHPGCGRRFQRSSGSDSLQVHKDKWHGGSTHTRG